MTVQRLLFLPLLLVPLVLAADNEQKINKSFALGPEAAVELSNVNGQVRLTTHAGNGVEIRAVKRSEYQDELDQVDIVFQEEANRLKVYTEYKKKNSRVRVDFEVVVPERLKQAVFKTVNGDIQAEGRFGDIRLETVNGGATLQGGFRNSSLATVNGDLEVLLEESLAGDVSARTVNGKITLELNRKSGFQIKARTVNGKIRSDFELTLKQWFIGSQLSGSVNEGQYEIKLETVNGNIELVKI